MSLINDALRRAQETRPQQPATPPPGPPMQPVHPLPARARWLGLMLIVAGLVVVAAALIWLGLPQTPHPATLANQSSPPQQPATAIALSPQPAAIQTVPPTQAIDHSPTGAPAATMPASPLAGPLPAPPSVPSSNAVSATESPTNTVAADTKETRQAVLPRLQGIIFHPTRPSAVLSGRLLFVGERIGQWRVTVIDEHSVTLVGAGQTNVLELP